MTAALEQRVSQFPECDYCVFNDGADEFICETCEDGSNFLENNEEAFEGLLPPDPRIKRYESERPIVFAKRRFQRGGE